MSDHLAWRFPVSVKGVLSIRGKFALLKNERDEWELPGGKLEPGEAIEQCIVRETLEELGVSTRVVRALNNWIYHVGGIDVVIITYSLELLGSSFTVALSDEHKELGLFSNDEVLDLTMPQGYKVSISEYIRGNDHE